MKRKTYVVVVSATNSVKKRARAGFKFGKDPRAVMVTLDRKLALQADSDLKVYRPKSDHYLRATGKEELPRSIENKMDAGLRKLHSTVIADVDYQRSEDSIRNELDMMGEEGIEEVAKELGIKAGKDEQLLDAVAAALLELEAEPAEIEAADDEPEEDEDEDEDETEDDDDSEDDEDEIDEEAVRKRFDELNAMDSEGIVKVLTKHGYENEGDKAGKILAILTEEFGEGVEDIDLGEVSEDEAADTEADSDDAEGAESDDEAADDADQPEKAKTAQKGKKKAAAKTKPKSAKKGGNKAK